MRFKIVSVSKRFLYLLVFYHNKPYFNVLFTDFNSYGKYFFFSYNDSIILDGHNY